MKNKTGWKYTLRKLGFILVLVALISSPFAVQAYKSITTTDPHVLIAREIEAFSAGAVDVVAVEQNAVLEDGIVVILFIDDYLRWSERIIENLNRHVMEVVRDREYDEVLMVLGWGAPVEAFLVQREIECTNLRVFRSEMCTTISVPGQKLPSSFIKWPGIGNP